MEKAVNERRHIWISEIKEDDQVHGHYLVKEKRVGSTKKGDSFLSLTLCDRTGEMEARVWERADQFSALFGDGDIIEVEGYAGAYRGQVQVTLSGLKVVKEVEDPGLFVEVTPKDITKMMASLREILRGIMNPQMKALVNRFLSDRTFVSQFKKAPAAKNFHHSYIGGLLEHTLSVCQMALLIAEHYPALDKDLLVTGAFLHDIGKVKELKFERQIDYSDGGRLLGHLVLGVNMMEEKLAGLKDFPEGIRLRLNHLILSHHGEYEFGSPKRPKFLEAFALHLIDDLDAKMMGLGRFMEKDRQEGAWTDFNRMFERYFLKGKLKILEEKPGSGPSEDEKQKALFSS
ncbi:MAG: HD domain-containing protein [Proteobacteria bacterium]|nr:HD domain-containing protein [Pseudomonadota bacterium]